MFFVTLAAPVSAALIVPISVVTSEAAIEVPASVPPERLTVLDIAKVETLSVPVALTVMAPEPKAELFPAVSVPALIVVPPPKELRPESVSTPAVVFTNEPPDPEIIPELVPAVTVSVVAPNTTAPPLSVVIVEVAPLRLTVPEVSVPIVATPPTVAVPTLKDVMLALPVTVLVPPVMAEEVRELEETVPPEMAPVSRPVTATVPAETPPLMVASAANEVLPVPDREASVIRPPVPVNCRAPAVVLAFKTPPSESVAPEIVAVPVLLRESVAADL